MKSTVLYSGWELTTEAREELIKKYPPLYSNVVCHHITYEYGPEAKLPPKAKVEVVGRTTSMIGLDVLIVKINGSFVREHNDSIYHITLSLGQGKRPVDSNRAAKEGLWVIDEAPFEVEATPKQF